MKKRIVEKIIRNHEFLNNAHAFGWKIPKIPFHTPEEVEHLKFNSKIFFRKRS